MLRTTRGYAAAALGLLLGVTACHNDELFRPANLTLADPLFTSYVSMGNSITAGFQSDGINDSLQLRAYPVLVAEAMGTPFFAPLMNRPGCRPPYTNIFLDQRVSGGTAATCALRATQPVPPPFISNVAVPGAEVIDALSNLATGTNANALTTFFLGGLTQVQAMQRANPTFVSVWLGNNDLLGAALASNPSLITLQAAFEANYGAVLDAVEAAGAEAVLIGVGLGNIAQTFLPFWSKGSTYYGLWLSGAFAPAPFTVAPTCAPPRGDSVFVPFPFGLGLINAGTPTTLDCTEPQTIQPAGFVAFVNAQAAYNAFIATEAASRGWAYMDLNATFDSLGAVPGEIAPFPNTSAACAGSPFGVAFSCDGIHPSTAAQRLIARKVVQAINAEYGTAIPAIP